MNSPFSMYLLHLNCVRISWLRRKNGGNVKDGKMFSIKFKIKYFHKLIHILIQIFTYFTDYINFSFLSIYISSLHLLQMVYIYR